MIADLKPYPEYKESGLQWLGRVPVHWSVHRIKTVLREIDFRSVDGSGTLLSLTRLRGLIPHRDMTDKVHSAKTLVGYKRYRQGQLVMNRMQAWNGMFGAGEIGGLVSPDYAVFDVLSGNAIGFVLERLKTADLVAQFALESKGIGSGFNRLYTDRFGQIPISLPPSLEQRPIVQFLNWANRRLARAIRAKQKVIALLNEQKEAIIHRAITRGLDSTVPLKPSGIPWLGDIPRHWEVRRLKDLSPRISGRLVYQPAQYFTEEGVPFLMGNNVTPDGIIWNNVRRISASMNARFAHHALREGDVVTVRVGAPGTTCQVPREADGLNCASLMIIRRSPRFHSGWLARTMNSSLIRDQIAVVQYGAAQEQININDAINFHVPVPPRQEQEHIAARIEASIAPIVEARDRVEREIELLREYRTRLVADVVTGKLDVREAAARLPDNAAADTPEEDASADDEIDPADEDAAAR